MNWKDFYESIWGDSGQNSTDSPSMSTSSAALPAGLTSSEYHRKLQDYYTAQREYAALQHAAQNYTFNVATQTTTNTAGYGYPAYSRAPWKENNEAALRQAMHTLSPEDCVTYMQMEADSHKWARLISNPQVTEAQFPGIDILRKPGPSTWTPCACHEAWWPTPEEIRELIAKYRLLYGG